MNNLQEHFQRELDIMRKSVDKDDPLIIEPFVNDIKNILDTFTNESYTGATAPLASVILTQTIKAILGYQVLSPLTGEDWEWTDISELHGSPLWQNVRDSGVFKDEEGNCTYSTSIVWVANESWDRFTGTLNGYSSSNYIKEFPFMPKTFFVEVSREPYDKDNPEHQELDVVDTGNAINRTEGEFVYKIKDSAQLEEVFNYYNRK